MVTCRSADSRRIKVMENRDILSVIAPKMDNETLFALFSIPSFKESLSKILTSRDYWYQRSMNLAGKTLLWRPEADWKKIYYVLEKGKSKPQYRYTSALGNLDSLLVVEEAYGRLILTESDLESYLKKTTDPRVFRYLLEKNNGKYDYDLWEVIVSHLENKNKEMVDELLTHVTEDQKDEDNMNNPLLAAISGDRLDVFKTFMEYPGGDMDIDRTEILEAIIREDNIEMYRYMMSRFPELEDDEDQDWPLFMAQDNSVKIMKLWFQNHELDEDTAQLLLEQAAENDSLDVIKYLEQETDIDWEKIIVQATQLGWGDVSRYALSRITDPEANLNSLLMSTVGSSSFSVILADPRSHPESILRELVDAISSVRSVGEYWRGRSAKSLILDPRIKTEDLEPYVVRSIFDSLMADLSHEHIQNAMSGYRLGTEISGYYSGQLAHPLSGTDAYSLVLREMIFKRPEKKQLVDWLLNVKLRDVARAAACVLDDKLRYSDEVAPLRALLLSILYPSMDLEESIMKLRQDGYRDQVLRSSGRLLGVYYSLLIPRPIQKTEDESDSPSEESEDESD